MSTPNYLTNQAKQFLRFASLYTMVLCLGSMANLAHSQDRTGNGGSGSEAELAAEQAVLEQTVGKIKIFFLRNPTLRWQFQEFEFTQFVEMANRSDIRVTNEQLIDRHGKIRTCLNFMFSGLIQCNYKELKNIKHSPQTVFVLMFHEMLGLLGVEETSPADVNYIDGYKISKKLAPYVVKTSNYDLTYASPKSSDNSILRNPSFPTTVLNFDAGSSADGICRMFGYEGGDQNSLKVQKYFLHKHVIKVQDDGEASQHISRSYVSQVYCMGYRATNKLPIVTLVKSPRYKNTKTWISGKSSVHGICKAMGHHRGVENSIQYPNGNTGKTFILDDLGNVVGTTYWDLNVSKILCLR